MQYFPLLNFQHVVLAFFLGIGFVILLLIAFSSYRRVRIDETEDELDRLVKGDLAEAHDPEGGRIAPVLVFIYLGAIVWSVSYFIVVGLMGGAF